MDRTQTPTRDASGVDAPWRPEAQLTVAWHALEADDVWPRLRVGAEGLDDDAAAARLAEAGPNSVGTDEPPSAWAVLLRQFTSPLIWILLVAAVVTVVIGEYVDTGVIAAVLVLNATIGFVQERKAEKSVQALMKLAAPKSTVRRGGRLVEVPSEEVVPGDVVMLESGVRVPADLRLVASTALEIDESLLTGESRPARKRVDPVDEEALAADRTSMAHMGSAVARGRGEGIVVTTGAQTELGQIAESIRAEEQPESPLTRRMHRFANIIALAVGGSALAALLLGLIVGEPIGEMFLTAVALAVAIVPEGLPIALTVAMALGVRRMARRRAIVRNLPAVETLGSTQVIGSDKTGTLTENRMTVTRLWTPDGSFAIRPQDATQGVPAIDRERVSPVGRDAASAALLTGVLTNESYLVTVDEDGAGPEPRGDPTEGALLMAAWRAGIEPEYVRGAHSVEAEQPFESALQYSASLRR
ncbi:cation-translocating P-type ATPase [Egibacter rhizosphaerae]|uniref:cation-translocating P-type ATPase n=1 Tax=Egibacter rhizosphaerae TaxID=1670831 RepID=UPI0013F154D7|nr:HAD-IC family P-type ATPase [Egibacter rhizosphaerae]